jgi:hypothetical protein
MNYIEFDIEKIGHFKTQESLTIAQDLALDSKVNDFLNGKLFEMEARAQKLQLSEKEEDQDAARSINTQLSIIRIMFELETVIVEAPEGYKKMTDLPDYATLIKIWNAYSQKKSELKSASGN